MPIATAGRGRCAYQELDNDLAFAAQQLDRSVTARNQIRTVLQCYKDNLSWSCFPVVPGNGFRKRSSSLRTTTTPKRSSWRCARCSARNDFAKKITYRVTGEEPATLIKAFRNEVMPRIAVTVDMIATGTDIKPVECIIFMRDVRSEGYFEQMKGRGVRTIDDSKLAEVTPDAGTKTRFVLIDAA